MEENTKCWGHREFWGLGYDWDPQWYLTQKQKELQKKLIELCRTTLRPNAVISDETYAFPRENMVALSKLGLLGLHCPKYLGGMGENHVCSLMVLETIARYGCPSTAMILCMHYFAVCIALFRCHGNKTMEDILLRLDKDVLVGTLMYSDPSTGGHFWNVPSSKVAPLPDGGYKVLKYASWTTSGGYADWYIAEITSPDHGGLFLKSSLFLLLPDDVRISADDWSALGLHGNQSGPIICEGNLGKDRLLGELGDSEKADREHLPLGVLNFAATWNGVAAGSIDIAKHHVTNKVHADSGMRVAEYPKIQDYFGNAIADTNSARVMLFGVADAMDKATNNNDWTPYSDWTTKSARWTFDEWSFQCRIVSAKLVLKVTDVMLQACGGTGFRTELGLERLLRDARAAAVMGPSNEWLIWNVGTTALLGADVADAWIVTKDHRLIRNEVKKLTADEKIELARKLLADAEMEKAGTGPDRDEGRDFYNPFQTGLPTEPGALKIPDGVQHGAGLKSKEFTPLKLVKRQDLSSNIVEFRFALPNASDYTGCLPGQYVQVRIPINGKQKERYLSPVSVPNNKGTIDVVMKYEAQGELSTFLKKLQPGGEVDFRGPCGGFEYTPNVFKEIILISSSIGVTPAIQLVRCIMGNPDDKTKVNLIHYGQQPDELLYRAEFEDFAKKDQRLKLVYTLGEPDLTWKGETGYINQNLLSENLPKPGGDNKYKIILCGGATMVTMVMECLYEMGYPSKQVFVYGAFGVEQVRAAYGRKAKLSSYVSK